MKRIDTKAAITILLGAAAILAVLFSPAGDQGFFAIVLLGPLVTGLVAGALGRNWRPAAAAWVVVGLFMLAFDWIAYDEDQGVHAVLTLLMVALVRGGAGLARLGHRLTSHRASRNALMQFLLVAAWGAALVAAPPAGATFPGENGVISFASNGNPLGTNPERDFEIFTMTAGGTILSQLTSNAAVDSEAEWSPDGSRIAFRSRRDAGDDEIYVMNADGTDQRRLTESPGLDEAPSWSADGMRTFWQSNRSGNLDIYVTNADGTGPPVAVTNHPAPEGRAMQAPDGRTIAFVRVDPAFAIYTMRSDGRNVRKLTDDALQASTPNWSPDGTTIAFNHNFCGTCADSDVFTMRANGQLTQRLTAAFGNNLFPAFSPDGEKLLFTHFPGADIYVTEADGSGVHVNLTNTPTVSDRFPAWQPLPDRSR